MSSSQPRTKPWEVSQGKSAASTTESVTSNIPPSISNSATTATTQGQQHLQIQPPTVPELPTSLSSDLNTMAESSPYGGYGNSSMNRYGTTGGYGSSMYGSGYGSSMYGNSMYGGYGSMYGGGYGGYGSGYGGYGSYGSGMYGGGMYGNNPSMMGPGGLGEGTQATFQLIESIIGAVGGFAQMLEATYMATHSSFFTMVNLAEQFGNLKNALGSILGIFALIKFVKKIFYKITGRVYNYGINASEFTKFEKNQKKLEENLRRNQSGQKPRISLKPLVLFLVAAVGFPYLLSKAIKLLEEKNQRPPQVPSKIQFARALYEFNPQNPQLEAPLEPKEIVAILDSRDSWLRIRKRSGTMGWVPLNYVEVIDT